MTIKNLPEDIAKHLFKTYGTSCIRVVTLGEENKKKGLQGQNERIWADYPFLQSEISYSIKYEMSMKPSDILFRRIPIAFLNKELAIQALDLVIGMISKEHNWSKDQ